MKKLITALTLLATAAWAGDRLLGIILVTDGGTVSNATTGYGVAGCSHEYDPAGAESCPQAFRIGTSALLSIQCKDQGAKFQANTFRVDAGTGIALAVDQFFTTSTGSAAVTVGPLLWADAGVRTANGMQDGGTYIGGVVSICPLAGALRAECNVWQRNGNE